MAVPASRSASGIVILSANGMYLAILQNVSTGGAVPSARSVVVPVYANMGGNVPSVRSAEVPVYASMGGNVPTARIVEA